MSKKQQQSKWQERGCLNRQELWNFGPENGKSQQQKQDKKSL